MTFGSGSANNLHVILTGVSAAGAVARYTAQVTFSTTASTGAAVAAEAVSAINASVSFTADGHYAVDNGDGTVTIRWGSANVLTQAAAISAGTTGISLSSTSAAPVNNTSAEIAAVVAAQLNADFAANSIYRAASNVSGSSGVTLTYTDADGDPLDPVFGGDTTGSNFTAVDVKSLGNIYIGGTTVQITPGTNATAIAAQVKTALDAQFAGASATQSRIVVNAGSGTITITYPDESPSVSMISYSADTNVGIAVARETVQVVDTSTSFANSGQFLKAGDLTMTAIPEPAVQRTITFGPSMTAAQHQLTFGAWSAGSTNEFSITTKGGSSNDTLVTSINLGTVEQTITLGAPTDASAELAGFVLIDGNGATYSVQLTNLNSADSAQSVACDFVSAANAAFSAAESLTMHMKPVLG
ncbi:MAG: hypothetical protein ACJ0F0_03750 [Burkholderiaceae bacterium]